MAKNSKGQRHSNPRPRRPARSFTEDERRTLAGFTYKLGKCSVTAARYHGADEAGTMKSLFQFVEQYSPGPADGALEDAVGGYSSADYWSDAKVDLFGSCRPLLVS
jgi:hypothetical protein